MLLKVLLNGKFLRGIKEFLRRVRIWKWGCGWVFLLGSLSRKAVVIIFMLCLRVSVRIFVGGGVFLNLRGILFLRSGMCVECGIILFNFNQLRNSINIYLLK